MKDEPYNIDVLFLVDDGEVVAYFPNEKYHRNDEHSQGYGFNFDMRTCYMHVGQHSACHPDYASECKEAQPEAYNDLKNELESIGYILNILNRGN